LEHKVQWDRRATQVFRDQQVQWDRKVQWDRRATQAFRDQQVQWDHKVQLDLRVRQDPLVAQAVAEQVEEVEQSEEEASQPSTRRLQMKQYSYP
jgi:uncharacterized protein YukE